MPSQNTLKDAGTQYFRVLDATGKNPRTVNTYRRHFEIVVGFFGEGRKLSAIRPADVGRFFKSDALRIMPNGKERADATVKQIVRVLRMFFERAVAQGMLESVPFPRAAMPKRGRKQSPHSDDQGPQGEMP